MREKNWKRQGDKRQRQRMRTALYWEKKERDGESRCQKEGKNPVVKGKTKTLPLGKASRSERNPDPPCPLAAPSRGAEQRASPRFSAVLGTRLQPGRLQVWRLATGVRTWITSPGGGVSCLLTPPASRAGPRATPHPRGPRASRKASARRQNRPRGAQSALASRALLARSPDAKRTSAPWPLGLAGPS